jgi:D-psicose/D-tagatose/L-ribulose 3-epimerase
MIQRSVSNLALPANSFEILAPQLRHIGIEGIEVAPTLIWPGAPNIRSSEIRAYAQKCRDFGLQVSGIQSLLFGRPEFQIFNRDSWPSMRKHLEGMIRLAGDLSTSVAVFGSPRNRVRGALSVEEAHETFSEFLFGLVPTLTEYRVRLAIEPNAPDYGADYILNYADSVFVADMISSPWIGTNLDTGCLTMVGEDIPNAVRLRMPTHVHVSAPHLTSPPGLINHLEICSTLFEIDFDGWAVLEMLPVEPDPVSALLETSRWLTETYQPHHK